MEAEPALPTVVIEPDFKLAAITTALALVLDSIPYVRAHPYHPPTTAKHDPTTTTTTNPTTTSCH